jgi:hypothetical protein
VCFIGDQCVGVLSWKYDWRSVFCAGYMFFGPRSSRSILWFTELVLSCTTGSAGSVPCYTCQLLSQCLAQG